jgi:hypothetical protein
MGKVVKVFFRHQEHFYSVYVTIVNEFDTNFICIEFLDDIMIGSFNTTYLSYVGERGFKKLDVYQSVYLRPILSNIGYIINNVQRTGNNCDHETSDEEYIRQN